MLTSKQSDRALPTFITLLVIGVLLMTFDVRLGGRGVVAVLRGGTQAIVSPMQRIAAYAVNPIANALDSLSNVASLKSKTQLSRPSSPNPRPHSSQFKTTWPNWLSSSRSTIWKQTGRSWGKPWPM